MKGVIFNIVEEVVVGAHGEPVWDSLLDSAGLEGVYTSLGSYDDAELFALVNAASRVTHLPPDEVLRWIGRQSIPLMCARWPAFFEAHATTLPFLRSLNSVIHPEVRKLYAGAHCPHFDYATAADGALHIGYRSPRQLCGLAHGFIEGTAAHYGEAISIAHLACMHAGDERCLLAVSTRPH